jgi:hypothetical protein
MRRLGRRAIEHVSLSGATVYAPPIIAGEQGRDLVRLSRLSPEFLRWLCAVTTGEVPRAQGNRLDWLRIAALAREWRVVRLRREELRAARIPMGAWRASTLAALDLGPPADAEAERERFRRLRGVTRSAAGPSGALFDSDRAALIVVRCPSTGHRHVLRAEVRWEDRALEGDVAVRAAIARSFGLAPAEYAPEVES